MISVLSGHPFMLASMSHSVVSVVDASSHHDTARQVAYVYIHHSLPVDIFSLQHVALLIHLCCMVEPFIQSGLLAASLLLSEGF